MMLVISVFAVVVQVSNKPWEAVVYEDLTKAKGIC